MSGQMAEQEGKRLELLKRLPPQVFRWRVRSEQSGRSRSELPMMVGTASTREFARRLRPVLALSGCANRACPRLLSMENGKTFARSEPFRF
jgi:hypothetical protein